MHVLRVILLQLDCGPVGDLRNFFPRKKSLSGAKHFLKKVALKYTSGGDFDVVEPGIKNALSIKVYFYSKHLPDMVTNVFLQHNKM